MKALNSQQVCVLLDSHKCVYVNHEHGLAVFWNEACTYRVFETFDHNEAVEFVEIEVFSSMEQISEPSEARLFAYNWIKEFIKERES